MTEQRNGHSPTPEDLNLTPGELAVAGVVARFASRGQRPPRGAMEDAVVASHRIQWGDYPAIAKGGLRKVVGKEEAGLPLDETEQIILQQLRTGFEIDTHYRELAGKRPFRTLRVFVDLWTRKLPLH